MANLINAAGICTSVVGCLHLQEAKYRASKETNMALVGTRTLLACYLLRSGFLLGF
jgi:hypothetical protein